MIRHFDLTLGTFLKFLGIILLIVGILMYVQFQARNLLTGPSISLETTPEIVRTEREVALDGMARNIVKLTLNGKEIHTNERGEFAETLILENGYTIMTLRAEDRFGRTTTLTRTYVYSPATS